METFSSTKLCNDDCGCKDTVFSGIAPFQQLNGIVIEK